MCVLGGWHDHETNSDTTTNASAWLINYWHSDSDHWLGRGGGYNPRNPHLCLIILLLQHRAENGELDICCFMENCNTEDLLMELLANLTTPTSAGNTYLSLYCCSTIINQAQYFKWWLSSPERKAQRQTLYSLYLATWVLASSSWKNILEIIVLIIQPGRLCCEDVAHVC